MPVIGKFEAARKASGLSSEKAATICHIAKPTYLERERYPSTWRLGELDLLYREMSDVAKPILLEAVNDIFLH